MAASAADAEARVRALEEQVAGLNDALEELTLDKDQLQLEKEELEEQLQAAGADNAAGAGAGAASASAAAAQEQGRVIEEQAVQIERLKVAIRTVHERSGSEKAELQAEIARLTAQVEEMGETLSSSALASSEEMIETMTEKNLDLEAQLVELRETLHSMEMAQEKAEEQEEKQVAEIKQLRQKLDSADVRSNRMETAIVALSEERQAAQHMVERMRTAMIELKGEHFDLEARLADDTSSADDESAQLRVLAENSRGLQRTARTFLNHAVHLSTGMSLNAVQLGAARAFLARCALMVSVRAAEAELQAAQRDVACLNLHGLVIVAQRLLSNSAATKMAGQTTSSSSSSSSRNNNYNSISKSNNGNTGVGSARSARLVQLGVQLSHLLCSTACALIVSVFVKQQQQGNSGPEVAAVPNSQHVAMLERLPFAVETASSRVGRALALLQRTTEADLAGALLGTDSGLNVDTAPELRGAASITEDLERSIGELGNLLRLNAVSSTQPRSSPADAEDSANDEMAIASYSSATSRSTTPSAAECCMAAIETARDIQIAHQLLLFLLARYPAMDAAADGQGQVARGPETDSQGEEVKDGGADSGQAAEAAEANSEQQKEQVQDETQEQQQSGVREAVQALLGEIAAYRAGCLTQGCGMEFVACVTAWLRGENAPPSTVVLQQPHGASGNVSMSTFTRASSTVAEKEERPSLMFELCGRTRAVVRQLHSVVARFGPSDGGVFENAAAAGATDQETERRVAETLQAARLAFSQSTYSIPPWLIPLLGTHLEGLLGVLAPPSVEAAEDGAVSALIPSELFPDPAENFVDHATAEFAYSMPEHLLAAEQKAAGEGALFPHWITRCRALATEFERATKLRPALDEAQHLVDSTRAQLDIKQREVAALRTRNEELEKARKEGFHTAPATGDLPELQKELRMRQDAYKLIEERNHTLEADLRKTRALLMRAAAGGGGGGGTSSASPAATPPQGGSGDARARANSPPPRAGIGGAGAGGSSVGSGRVGGGSSGGVGGGGGAMQAVESYAAVIGAARSEVRHWKAQAVSRMLWDLVPLPSTTTCFSASAFASTETAAGPSALDKANRQAKRYVRDLRVEQAKLRVLPLPSATALADRNPSAPSSLHSRNAWRSMRAQLMARVRELHEIRCELRRPPPHQ